MLLEKVVNVGIGQCGSNFVAELEKFSFNSFYVNSSLEDLDTIETDKKNKYHLKGLKGMAKDRNLAMKCIASDNTAESIAYAIYDQYAFADIIYFYYSLSGGTGGTMGNVIAEVMADLFPDKIINVVAILPKSNDDIGLLANAIESLEHLKTLQKNGVITQIHLLDNNAREDIFSINKDFAICFSKFVTFDEITKTGNLDEEEKERVLIEPGMGTILEFSDDDFGNGIANASENTIYSEWVKSPSLHGLILNRKQNKDVNREVIKDVLGRATFTHHSTWDNDSNVLIAVGMPFNDGVLNKLKKDAKEQLDKKIKAEEEASKQLDLVDVDFDASTVLNSTNSRRRPSSVASSTPSRRRGEKRASSVLDKYRSM